MPAKPKPRNLADLIILMGGRDVKIAQAGDHVHLTFRRDPDASAALPIMPYRDWIPLFEQQFGVHTVRRDDLEVLRIRNMSQMSPIAAEDAMDVWSFATVETIKP